MRRMARSRNHFAAIAVLTIVAVFVGTATGLTSESPLALKDWNIRCPMCLGSSSNVDDLPASGSREKTIVFIRHGRSHMNDYINGVHYGGPGFTDVFPDTPEYKRKYLDSPLAPRGEEQVQILNEQLQRLRQGDFSAATELKLSSEHHSLLGELELIVTSPLTRALQTMEKGVYPSVAESGSIPVVAVPQAAERLFMVSDFGKTRRQLKEAFPFVDFDSGFLPCIGEDDDWHYVPSEEDSQEYTEWRPNGQGQVYACLGEPEHRFEKRMEELLEWLESRSESTIAVVCHGGVILWFLGELIDNCGVRVVDFDRLRNPKRAYEPDKEEAARLS